MGLFGSGHLRRQIQAMTDELDAIKTDLGSARAENGELKKQLSDRDSVTREARDHKKRVDKKLEKVTNARRSAEKRLQDQSARLEAAESDAK
jgi:archaellum component FlaC